MCSCEPRTNHDVARTRSERKRNIARVANAAVGPNVTTERACFGCTFKNCRKLWASHSGHHACGAHCTGPNTNLDDVGAGIYEIANTASGNNVAGTKRNAKVEGLDRADCIDHFFLMAMGGVENKNVDACFNEQAGFRGNVTVHANGSGDTHFVVGIDSWFVQRRAKRTGTSEDANERT